MRSRASLSYLALISAAARTIWSRGVFALGSCHHTQRSVRLATLEWAKDIRTDRTLCSIVKCSELSHFFNNQRRRQSLLFMSFFWTVQKAFYQVTVCRWSEAQLPSGIAFAGVCTLKRQADCPAPCAYAVHLQENLGSKYQKIHPYQM